jgi:tetratricopeptide (TPR) repeat protein
MRNISANGRAVSALAGAWLLSACAVQPPVAAVPQATVEAYVADHPAELRRLTQQVPLQGDRNRALNQMRSGLAAMELGRLDIAAAAFDDALRIIEAIYADNPAAERARSVWYAESAKDFKGEPYERAMAYYYRGLVYLMQGDYQTARASFRGGLLQDSFMEENQRMTSDFGALAFLEGWAGRCAGFDAQTVAASFSEAHGRNAALAEPAAGNSLIVLFETGTGPQKRTAGSRNEVLGYTRGTVAPLTEAEFVVGGRGARVVQAEDLFYQAATRSGRWVDTINQGKVVYQSTTRSAGQAATMVGAGLLAASGFQGNSRASNNISRSLHCGIHTNYCPNTV